MKNTILSRMLSQCIAALCTASASTAVLAQEVVHKTAEPFESVAWKVDDGNTAGGVASVAEDVAAELTTVSKHSLSLTPSFSGKGFEFFRATPAQPLVIPGVTKTLSLWVRNEPKYGWVMQFKDGWGRGEVDGKKLEWNITQGVGTAWKHITFDVPADWVQPLRIDGVLVHNWENQSDKATGHLNLDQLEVDTDIAGVDPKTGILKTWKAPAAPVTGKELPKAPVAPLRSVSLSGGALHNVFSGEKPVFLLAAQNWRPASAMGIFQFKVTGPDGAVAASGSQPLAVKDTLALTLPIDTPKYGVYQLSSTVFWNDGEKVTSAQPYAVIPVALPLTDAEKETSPYGLNVLSARQPMVSTFRKAGIVWFRDYGFNYDWMVRAKGSGDYSGWPYYPKIVQDYDSNGARVLANFQSAIHPPAPGTEPGPNAQWTKELVGMLTAFPSIHAFELDNEYDLNGNNIKAEEPIAWKNYGLYHKKFGDVIQLLGNGKILAVENGRAGMWPERLRRMVKSGDFAPIDVVNSHHYAGVDPPETNAINHNMGFAGDEQVMSFFDQLRAVKKAGSADGKARQHWLTEFGWDTKAGPVVSPLEQAAYLQRAFMLLNAAGTSKGFWYWDLDSPVANQFFDGCGLFTSDQKPKLSYAAYAGLTQMLPRPEYMGTINAGEGAWGYLFRNDGKLVAALWTLDGKPGPKVDFGAAKVYDYLANPLAKSSVELGIAPVYAVGVSEDSRWYRQAAYSLESQYLTSMTAGDTVTANVRVKNTRNAAIKGKLRLELPQGWTTDNAETAIDVPAGQTADYPLTFHIANTEPLGEKTVRIAISEGEPLTVIPVRVQVQRPIVMTVSALKGAPGASDVSIHVSNRSAQPINGALTFHLPAGWSAATPEIKVDRLGPKETREVHAKVTWNADWKEGESAFVQYKSADGRSAEQPLIPSRLTIHSAPNLAMDGNLKDWPASTKLPAWILGSTLGDPGAAVYMAWSPKGLYVAADVHDAKASVPDPRSFWASDVLELFVDTHNAKTPRKYQPGDHQFWLAPQVDRKRVYVGQWKRNDEIPATLYDIPGIQSAAVRKGDGYVMECLIPAVLLKGYTPQAGAQLGLNLNVTVKGASQDREVYWSLPKSEGTEHPDMWGTVTLAK